MYRIEPATEDHIEGLYSIIRQWPDVWELDMNRMSYYDFVAMFKTKIRYSLVYAGESGKILVWGYVGYVAPNVWSDINIFKNRDHDCPDFTAVCRSGLNQIFTDLNLKVIRAFIREDNLRAGELMRNLGFKREGILKCYRKVAGEWRDYFLYSLVKGD